MKHLVIVSARFAICPAVSVCTVHTFPTTRNRNEKYPIIPTKEARRK